MKRKRERRRRKKEGKKEEDTKMKLQASNVRTLSEAEAPFKDWIETEYYCK